MSCFQSQTDLESSQQTAQQATEVPSSFSLHLLQIWTDCSRDFKTKAVFKGNPNALIFTGREVCYSPKLSCSQTSNLPNKSGALFFS